MLSWEKWNASLIWLRNIVLTPLDTIWATAKQWPVASIIGGIVVLLGAYSNKTEIWDFLNHAQNGKIIVNSPTVYTRQRLVNDRLDQARWLRTQLESTEMGHDKEFKSIDELKNLYSNIQAKVGGASGEKTSEKVNLDSTAVEATTMALFRAKNAYREEVRSEITQTELDDRHDIKGNTIFRLAFDASIIAGTRRSSVAGISVKLGHHPETAEGVKKDVYDDDYRSLYDDWVRYFQDSIRKSLSIVPKSIMSPDAIPQLRIMFTEFLLRRICQFVSNDPSLTIDPPECGAEQRHKAEALLVDYTKKRFEILTARKMKIFESTLLGYRTANYEFPLGNMEQWIGNASRICADDNKNEIALWQLKIKLPRPSIQPNPSIQTNQRPVRPSPASQQGQKDQSIGRDQRNQENLLDQQNAVVAEDLIGCPFYDSLQERMISGVLLYENLFLIARKQPAEVTADDYESYGTLAKQELADCSQGACDVNPSRLRCFSADFIKSNLNSFLDSQVPDQQKTKHYLNLEIVGRAVNDCNILVSPLPSLNTDSDGKTYSPLEAFVGRLNGGTDAFAYSVTPKNLTENISTAAETRDAFEMLFRAAGEGKEIANLLRQRSEQNRSVVAHPIVVGFGTPNDARRIVAQTSDEELKLAGIRDINFGWIIAPRSRSGGEFEQIDGQYSLTAFISVPGWWRTVEADIRTCWLPRAALAELKSAEDICPDGPRAKPSAVPVRLPSAIPEISRKLGFDVVQQPSLYEPRPKELIVGLPGSLLLEGARLWRSTEVTAGAQRAYKISVLPNMEGILAEFKCVLPPAGQRQIRRNSQVKEDQMQTITMDLVRVWTSEGVTEPIPVTFIWPNHWEKLLADCQKLAIQNVPLENRRQQEAAKN